MDVAEHLQNGDDEYQCAECKGVFEKGWSDDEALAESDSKFPTVALEDMAVVCDDCFNQMMRGH